MGPTSAPLFSCLSLFTPSYLAYCSNVIHNLKMYVNRHLCINFIRRLFDLMLYDKSQRNELRVSNDDIRFYVIFHCHFVDFRLLLQTFCELLIHCWLREYILWIFGTFPTKKVHFVDFRHWGCMYILWIFGTFLTEKIHFVHFCQFADWKSEKKGEVNQFSTYLTHLYSRRKQINWRKAGECLNYLQISEFNELKVT